MAGHSAVRREDGSLGTPPELGDGDSFEDLLSALADPALAAVTVMHADAQVIPDAIEIIRSHFAGPIGHTPRPADGRRRTGSSTA